MLLHVIYSFVWKVLRFETGYMRCRTFFCHKHLSKWHQGNQRTSESQAWFCSQSVLEPLVHGNIDCASTNLLTVDIIRAVKRTDRILDHMKMSFKKNNTKSKIEIRLKIEISSYKMKIRFYNESFVVRVKGKESLKIIEKHKIFLRGTKIATGFNKLLWQILLCKVFLNY